MISEELLGKMKELHTKFVNHIEEAANCLQEMAKLYDELDELTPTDKAAAKAILAGAEAYLRNLAQGMEEQIV